MDTIDVGIVGYKGGDHLVRCLKALSKQRCPINKVFYLNNSPGDDSERIAKENLPVIEVLPSRGNLGYAGGHNTILEDSRSTFYMPLNPDVVLEPEYISCILNAVQKLPEKAGAFQGAVLYENAPAVIYALGHRLTWDRRNKNLGFLQTYDRNHPRQEEVFGVNGACPVYRRALLDDIRQAEGIFDGRFFMYEEDFDVNCRFRLRGWRAYLVGEAIAFHGGGGTLGLKDAKVFSYYIRNRLLCILKNDTWMQVLQNAPFVILSDLLYFLRMLPGRPAFAMAFPAALLRVLFRLPAWLKSRREIQRGRLVSGRDVERWKDDRNVFRYYYHTIRKGIPAQGKRVPV